MNPSGLCRAVFVAFILLSSLIVIELPDARGDSSDDAAPELKAYFKKTYDKSKPNWNKNNYDWKGIDNGTGSVKVIISLSELDFKNLDRKLQKKLEKSKDKTFEYAFTGLSAELDADTIIGLMEANPQIQIQPDFPVSIMVNVNQTGADALWNRTDDSGWPLKGKGITVSIIDTGIDYNHPDLGGGFGVGYRVKGGYDFVNNDANPMDDHGHGTHCAGIVGANGTIFGMAPEVEFLAYKALDAGGSGYTSDIIEALERSMDPNDDGDTSDHADVVSMSLGGEGSPTDSICLAVEAAIAVGCVVIIAAGNDYYFGTVSSPGLSREAITVGSITSAGLRSDFSSHGTTPYTFSKPEICAPGSSIYSTYLYSGYRTWSGTSMATPHVAGAVAQILQDHPGWEPWQVKSALITGVRIADDSIWKYGAGALWVPNATDEVTFNDQGLVSYGWDYGSTTNITVQNNGSARNYTISLVDWHGVWGNYTTNGTPVTHTPVSAASATPAYLDMAEDSIAWIELSFSAPEEPWPEGYYEGHIELVNDTHEVLIPFTYLVMCDLNVQIIKVDGSLMSDGTGRVTVYEDSGDIWRNKAGTMFTPVPPYRTHVLSGTYNVHAYGHMLIYTYTDPYFLYESITLTRLQSYAAQLNMAEAKKVVLDLSTEDDHPIYVKEFRYYWRHVGSPNMSVDNSVGDYSIVGNEYFSVPKSQVLYVSETPKSCGWALVGYAYSDVMYQFMYDNYDHWYEYVSGTSTAFNIASSTDLQYLLSWEFGSINASDEIELSINWSRASAYTNHYDTPGWIYNPWLNWGGARALGGVAAFFTRRDTPTSVEPFFTGMNRTTIVQGPHVEWYASMGLFEGLTKAHWSTIDWDYESATTTYNVYVPSREYYSDYPQGNQSYRMGAGAVYWSAYMENTNTSGKMYQPLFRDTNDIWIGPAYGVTWYLYRGTSQVASYSMGEASTNIPGAYKLFTISSTGWYHAKFTNVRANNIMTTRTDVDMGFLIPGLDVTPPWMMGFDISRKFVAGEDVGVSMEVSDDSGTATPSMWWRDGVTDSWTAVSLSPLGGGAYDGAITTLVGTTMIDLMLNISDPTGNYLNYTMHNVSRVQIDVDFNVSVFGGTPDIPYRNSEQRITLVGYLTSSGSALHATGGVPIDLYCDGNKVGMILDENMTIDSHTHNGTIRFDWDLNPTKIFGGPGETKTINVKFDLGIYESVWSNFTMKSVADTDEPPVIMLYTPANNSAVLNGTLIDFEVTDESLTSANYSWDNATATDFSFPFLVDTEGLTDGYHWLRINATDANTTSSWSWRFRVDTEAPTVVIDYPANGTSMPEYTYINATVTEPYGLPNVFWEIEDGLRSRDYNAPYQLSTADWDVGWYNVTVLAYDSFGHYSVAQVNFNITALAPVITNTPSLTGTTGIEYLFNATCTVADLGVNTWNLETNATWLNLNYTDQTHGMVNGISGAAGYFWINLSVSDDDSEDFINWTVTIEEAGTPPAPTITSTASIGAREDHPYSYTATADQAIDTWAGSTNATWLTFEPTNATLWGTPDNAVSEWDSWANISCTNANGSAYQNFSIHVWNLAPAFTPDLGSPPITGVVGRELVYDANHSDEAIGTPPGNFTNIQTNFTGSYSFDEATGLLIFTPLFYGELWWNITGNDQRGMDNSTSYQNWTMLIEEKAPYIVSSPVATTIVWELFYFNCSSTPADVGINVWAYESNATWLSFIWGNQTLYNVSGTPTELASYYINFSIQDDDSNHYLNFTLDILPGGAPGFTSTPSTEAWEDYPYSYEATANQTVSWAYISNGTWLSMTLPSVSGTPTNAHALRVYFLNITITNMNGTAFQNFSITIWNNPPILSGTPGASGYVGSAYSFDLGSTDEGIGTPTPVYNVTTNALFWYFVNESTGLLLVIPNAEGTYWFDITFDDLSGAANATAYLNFTVSFALYVPGITPPDPTIPHSVYPAFEYIVDGFEVFFTDKTYGEVASIYWDFGDGTGSTAQNPIHKYKYPGIYEVTLTVIATDGESRSLTTRISVGLDEPFSATDQGWRLVWDDDTVITVSAVGMAALGISLWISSFLFPKIPVITKKGRRVLGILCILAASYYFVFVNNGWMP